MESVRTRVAAESTECIACHASVSESRCAHCGVVQQVNGYQIEAVIAQTPHSRVYRARGPSGQLVALKELLYSTVPGLEELEAFEREAAALRSLSHSAIPKLVGSFRDGDGLGLRLYLAQEYVAGQSLAERLKQGPLPEDEVRPVADQLLRVLEYLHGQTPALLHRDIKPSNIMRRADGQVVLVDFGSARFMEGSRTHRSTLVGTFGYMPPEQLGGTVDRTSDTYAVCATLLHALTGRAPSQLLDGNLQLTIPAGVPPAWSQVLRRGLSIAPTKRFATARDLRLALASRRSARRLTLALSVTVGLVTLVGIGARALTWPTREIPPVPEAQGAATLQKARFERATEDYARARAFVEAHRDETRRCYEQAAGGRPRNRMGILVRWLVSSGGLTKNVAVMNNPQGDPSVGLCLSALIGNWDFGFKPESNLTMNATF